MIAEARKRLWQARQRWLMGLETNAVEKGLIDPDELAAG